MRRVYKREQDGLWVYLFDNNSRKVTAETQEEILIMAAKVDFANKVMETMTLLAGVMDDGPDITQLFFDRGYNAGGSDPITDGDISATGITAAQLSSCVTLLQNLNKFFNADETQVTDAYRVTVNATRNYR